MQSFESRGCHRRTLVYSRACVVGVVKCLNHKSNHRTRRYIIIAMPKNITDGSVAPSNGGTP